MKYIAALLTLAALVAGCGATAGPAALKAPTGMQAAAANPWLGLDELEVKAGGPSDWYTRTQRHLSAKTAKNGRLWVLDNPTGVEVLHNTQEVTNAKKLAQIATAIEEAAENEFQDPELQQEAREFAAMIREAL